MSERQLPHSVTAERAVLGAVILKPELFPTLDLAPESFYDPKHKSVWSAMADLASSGAAIDTSTLQVSLERSNKLDAIGGVAYLSELALATGAASAAPQHALTVRQCQTAREVMLAASEVLERGYGGETDGDELLTQLTQAAKGIRPGKQHEVVDAMELAKRRVRELWQQASDAASGKLPPRLPTGLEALDRHTGGLPRGNHTGLVAQPGHGKTATLVHMARHAPCPVLMFVFEELGRDMVDRLFAQASGIPANDISALRIPKNKLGALAKAEVPKHVHFVSARGMTDADVVRVARRVVPEIGAGLVLVDYLNRVQLSASPKMRQDERLRHAVGSFDDACGELDVAWVTASQVNRSPGKEDRPPRISDARECPAMEEYSKLGLVVHRPNKLDPDKRDDELNVIIDKQNMGEDKKVCRFAWDGPTMTISPLRYHEERCA